MRIEELVKGFEEWARLQYSPTTVRTYKWYVEKFLEEYGGPVEELQKIVEFINKFESRNARMVCAHALIAFYNYLGRGDIASRIPKPRGAPNPPQVLTYDFDKIRRAILMLSDPRDRALLCVAYELALRAKEVTLLKRSDFDPETCRIKIRRVKRPQGVPEEDTKILPEWCCRQLDAYLSTRRDSSDVLFVSRRGTPLSYSMVHYIFRRFAKLIGMPNARFHQLRHTAITEKALSLDLTAVAKYAGHKNPASSLVYIHLAMEQLLKKLKPADREKLIKQIMEQIYGR